MNDGPLIVQSDKTILLEVDHELATEARHAIAAVRRAGTRPRARPQLPAHAAGAVERPGRRARRRKGAGHAAEVLPVPGAAFPADRRRRDHVPVRPAAAGKGPQHGLVMRTSDYPVLEEVSRGQEDRPAARAPDRRRDRVVHSSQRGQLKQLLLKIGWPAEDLAGYVDGTPHPIMLDESGWKLRPYQRLAMENFWAGGSGVVVLPCGAGKTLGGGRRDGHSSTTTLILVTNTVVRPAVEGRAPQAHVPDRRGDRRILRLRQGGPSGHDRHLPGADHASAAGCIRIWSWWTATTGA